MGLVPAERVELPTHALRIFGKLYIRAQLHAIARIKSINWDQSIARTCTPMHAVVYPHYGIAMAGLAFL